MPDGESARRLVHAGACDYAEDGEVVVGWCIVVEVARPDGGRGLLHRAGGGLEGAEAPVAWTAAGMLMASSDLARAQMYGSAADAD